MNNINITGNITAKPVIRGTEKKAANFTVAVRGRGEHTDFIRCVAFGKTAEYLEKNADKGDKVAVAGSLHIDSYEKDGVKVPTAEVYCNNVELSKKMAKAEADAAPEMEELADEEAELPFN